MQSTSEIINIIMQSDSADILNSDIVQGVSFEEYIEKLMKEHNVTKVQLLDGICVERSYGYQILNGRRMPTRIILLRIAIFLHLDLKATQKLLSVGKKEALYPKNRFDAILIFAIGHDYDLSMTEELLVSMGEKPLFAE
ncbi:MAG: helix-turn-helix transcriptional regulator [Lachnospiraceae bacterium]|nr:helix-turn-helix transcriptional regulator [Lachnospiraceae bacterium]